MERLCSVKEKTGQFTCGMLKQENLYRYLKDIRVKCIRRHLVVMEEPFFTASADKTARLWSIETGLQLRVFKGHTDELMTVTFSPNGETILTGSKDTTARLWDIKTQRLIHTFKGHTSYILLAVFSPDGSTVLTGSADKTARLWDVQTGSELRLFKGHTDFVWAGEVSLDGGTVLTGSDGKQLACGMLKQVRS